MRSLVILLTYALIITSSVFAQDYLLGKGDVLEVSVWGVPDMSRSVIVRPDGKITLPAVGDILADGLTPEGLSKALTSAMKKFIKQPVVTVSVQEIRNNRVFVTGGEMSRVVEMTTETTLLRLMSELGDFSQVDLRRAYLSRAGEKFSTDFYALFFEGDLSQDVELQADDIIFIPSNVHNRVYVLGAVTTPQPVQFMEGMRILDAILAAGGFTEFGKEESVTVVKKDKTRIKIDLERVRKGKDVDSNVLLSPGDYVLVEESFF